MKMDTYFKNCFKFLHDIFQKLYGDLCVILHIFLLSWLLREKKNMQ